MHLCFIATIDSKRIYVATFTPLRKEKKEEKITLPTFEGSHLGSAWRDLVEI